MTISPASVNKVAETALLVTPIVFRHILPSISPVGCGLYLEIEGDIFLITAGHLLNLEDWPGLVVKGKAETLVNFKSSVIGCQEMILKGHLLFRHGPRLNSAVGHVSISSLFFVP